MNKKKDEKVDLFLNAKGVPCPIPYMRVRLSMRKIPPGGIMKVLTEDSHTEVSILKYCRKYGHKILLFFEENGVYTFIIRKHGEEKEED
ncbi:MAG: sulfurtransferase TusA family protein [Asgard group archaeon]|nr:sulfurtransferase TusA family protein [Asgard group archaeon]